ncbi:hypothetical protein [Geomicrobium sp. JCM 19038]|uniref:hypothetical protein n=1 Tax=Geomicrobium sp. JCM 19038 TaxID=1460635 RepID=UPI00045F4D9A|nr:hypothetical protein [Geomicrobium sp. JCM 19038]GAK09026.1 hypothetical protein JCM19038_2837 [Geomicrobium sp. JCM 19038]
MEATSQKQLEQEFILCEAMEYNLQVDLLYLQGDSIIETKGFCHYINYETNTYHFVTSDNGVAYVSFKSTIGIEIIDH